MLSEPTVVQAQDVPSEVRVTVVLPVRLASADDPLLQRLGNVLLDDRRPADVGVLVVDDGSPQTGAERIRERCERHGFGYLRLDTAGRHFSIGRCRNVAAMHARSRYVMFQDVDLLPYPGFYADVLRELDVQGLDDRAADFLMIGVIYLTEEASRELFDTPAELRRQQFIHHLLAADETRIAKFSTGTSVNVYNRVYFLGRGGNDPEFEGWGFEDLELNTRCIRRLGKFPLPEQWLLDYGSFQGIGIYRGWKSVYRLQGDLTFNKGIVLFHAWHPVEEHSEYIVRRAENERLFHDKMRRFKETGEEPPPLPDRSAGRTLVFRDNAFVQSRDFLPMLGEVVRAGEGDFAGPDELEAFLRDREIDRVLFHNPYVNDAMRMLYGTCRERGLPYLVAERGSLPRSVFFDPGGFNADSDSYDASRWDRPLTPAERASLQAYVEEQRGGDDTLEKQGDRLGVEGLRAELGIAPSERVLFVPLQRPKDTVIEFHAGPIGSFDRFVELVREVTTRLGRDWRVVVKPHPLEDDVPEVPGAIVTRDGNIKDLLAAAEAVLCINSGCGVLAMLWDKPVIHAGAAHYGDPALSRQAATAEEVLRLLEQRWRPDPEKTARFLSYLIHELYSFGELKTREVRMPDGSRMTATSQIDFEVIRGLPGGPVRFHGGEPERIGTESILFDRYREAGGRLYTEPARRRRGLVELWPDDPPGFLRKLRKLHRDPVRFLADSRSAALRRLARPFVVDGSGR